MYFLSRTALLHAADAVVALEITGDVRISFHTRRGEWRECELPGSSYVSPHLTIVRIRPRGRWRARRVILVPDNVDPADFRRLRTWLRWRGHESLSAAGQ